MVPPIPCSASLIQVALAGAGGAVGILVGNPADVVNVRMQNDMRLPPGQRLGYRNVLHGLWTIAKVEGPGALVKGLQANIPRSMLINIGQVSRELRYCDITKHVYMCYVTSG